MAARGIKTGNSPPGSGQENPHHSEGFLDLIPEGNSKEKEKSGKIPLGTTRRQQGADPGTDSRWE